MLAVKYQNPDLADYTRCTVVVELPTKSELIEAVELGNKNWQFLVGLAKLHPKDQFVKKVGKEKALRRLDTHPAKLSGVHFRESNRVVFEFVIQYSTRETGAQKIIVGVSYVPESRNTRLEYLYVQ